MYQPVGWYRYGGQGSIYLSAEMRPHSGVVALPPSAAAAYSRDPEEGTVGSPFRVLIIELGL